MDFLALQGENMSLSIEIQHEHVDEECYIRAKGDLIITNANQMQDVIDEAIQQGHTEIHLDLTGIQYIDSFGIGVVVKTKTEIDKRKGRLIVQVNPTLQELFAKCHLDDYIELDVIS